MAVTPEQAWQVFREADLLHDAGAMEAALDAMAVAISGRLADSNPLVLCVLTGAVVVTGKLLPRLQFPLELDYIHATRYGAATRGGTLDWVARPRTPLAGRTVLVVDDILDEGVTLHAIVDDLRGPQGCAAVHTAVLVEKLHERKSGLEADFVGVRVPDRYVFGYGMDYKGALRNAPGIYAVREG